MHNVNKLDKILNDNTALFQEVIKEKQKEGKTPMVVIFCGADMKVETFHREGVDANMLRAFLQSANEWADRLANGATPDDYFPEDFKSKD